MSEKTTVSYYSGNSFDLADPLTGSQERPEFPGPLFEKH